MVIEKERRRERRVEVQQIVSLLSSTCTGDRAAVTQDISLGGALVKTNSCVAEGSEVSLVVALPAEITGTGESRMLCRGKVLRREERGPTVLIAVKFSEREVLPTVRARAA